jgi:subtilase family serine protease
MYRASRRRLRAAAGRSAVAAVASAALLASGMVFAVAASAQTVAPAPAQAKVAPDYEPATCAAPTGAGEDHCFLLIRTNVQHHMQNALSPDAAPTGDGYGPNSLQSAYNLTSASAADGSGETVAVVDAYNDPDAAADLSTYRSAWGLPACTTASGCLKQVNQNGKTSPLPKAAGTTEWDVEESLDIDMVSAICPECHILLVEASGTTTADLGTAVNSAVRLGAVAVSNSYGGSESTKDPTYDTDYYKHAGVAVTASAGDSDYGVSYPAASQYVTSVGGTSLTQSSSTARGWTETVWNTLLFFEGTGSGCSADDAKPSWQKDTGCAKRTDNDVAADADPNTGVAVYDTYSQGGWLEVGGTSASSPMIAAVFALAGKPAAGTFPSSYTYKHTSDLYDITSGYNGICFPTYLCMAQVGYDGPTGNGTPDGITDFKS